MSKRKENQIKRTNKEFTQKLIDHDEVELRPTGPSSQTISAMHTGRPVSSSNPANPSNVQQSTPVATHRPSFQEEHKSTEINNIPNKAIIDPKDGYRWDLCIAIKNPDFAPPDGDVEMSDEERRDAKAFFEDLLERLYLAGLQSYSYISGDGDEILVKIRAPIERLEEHAELKEFEMKLNMDYLRKHVDNQRNPIQHNTDVSQITPYMYIYAPYTRGMQVNLNNINSY
jgi:hypothetical protein